MRHLAHIYSAYPRIDRFLELEILSAAEQAVQKLLATQVLNDQVHFLLRFGQLEPEIEATCRTVIRRRRNDSAWRVRRGWDLYDRDDPRLSWLGFEDRVKFVLDQREERGSAHAKVMIHYGIRNRIAHGELHSTGIDVEAFVQDCSSVQAALRRAF